MQHGDAAAHPVADPRHGGRPCPDHRGQLVDRPQQVPGPQLGHGDEVELEPGGDADPAAAAESPECVAVHHLGRVFGRTADLPRTVDVLHPA